MASRTLRRRLADTQHLVTDNIDLPKLPKTLSWHDADFPDWMRDNSFITSGYRRVQNHWRGTFASVFGYLHNESVNIHTHLWGAMLFLYYLITLSPSGYFEQYPSTTWVDVLVFSIFLISAMFCLAASAFFHTSTCHSQVVAKRCVAFDYSGIIILILGSMYGSIYYGFFCHPHYQLTYISVLTLVGLGAAYVVLQPEYAKHTHRGLRTSVFVCLGLTGVIPVCHTLITHGVERIWFELGTKWLILSAALYIFGALLYANRIPERFAPGRFDYFFSSHQIFHVCVVLAALAHFQSISTALDFWHSGAVCAA